jgi:ribosomal protein S18 acetylase RimI-like enzyme
MNNLTIRRYQEQDKEAIWQLHVDGLNQTSSFVSHPELDLDFENINGVYIERKGEFFVASLNNTIIGMGALKQIDTDTAEIKRMRVHFNHQGKGIGSMILEKLLVRAKELGYSKLILDTTEKQVVAQKMYEKHGFMRCNKNSIGSSNVLFYQLDL